MTEREILAWIKTNLAPHINKALADYKKINPALLYTEDWLGGIAMREVGNLINRYAPAKMKFDALCSLMKGDYTQRKGETEKQYHGFSFFQIDIASYPDFIKTGNWKDPYKSAFKAIAVLEEKRRYLEAKCQNLKGDALHRAITAAYNTGQGNVAKSVAAKRDVDATTAHGNYSAAVWKYRETYKTIAKPV